MGIVDALEEIMRERHGLSDSWKWRAAECLNESGKPCGYHDETASYVITMGNGKMRVKDTVLAVDVEARTTTEAPR